MLYYLYVAMSLTILPAAIIGLLRYKAVLKVYYPFIYMCWLGVVGESASIFAAFYFRNNIIFLNVYTILEAFFFLSLFKNWGTLNRKGWHFRALFSVLLLIWFADVLFWHRTTSMASGFNICYAFILIFLAISEINKLIMREQGNILRNAKFLICSGLIILNAFKTFIQVFLLMPNLVSDSFMRHVYLILMILNVFVNLIFALAALWIPTRQKFTQSF